MCFRPITLKWVLMVPPHSLGLVLLDGTLGFQGSTDFCLWVCNEGSTRLEMTHQTQGHIEQNVGEEVWSPLQAYHISLSEPP